MILQVRYGTLPLTATPAASALVMAASGVKDRVTPDGVPVSNPHYEGDWDARITSEAGETAAHQVCRVWRDSRITGDADDE